MWFPLLVSCAAASSGVSIGFKSFDGEFAELTCGDGRAVFNWL